MRAAAIVAAALLVCTGCTSFENPIVGEGGPALDSALIGRWSCIEEQGSAHLEITRDGNEGHLRMTVTENGKPAETEDARLITARVEQQTFASVWGGNEGRESWTLVRYELHPPGRLSIYLDNNRFWNDAVRNKIVPGELGSGDLGTSARVTASSVELGKIVQGYGSLIFDDTTELVFTRD